MITLGVDAHKRVHVAVAVDEAGRELGEWRGANSRIGWRNLLDWSESFGPERQWGIEGAWNYGRGMAQHLVVNGEVVYEINTRWTALGRRRAKKLDKTDQLDARAVARFVRAEAPALPAVYADDETAVLDALCVEREGLLSDACRLRNQLHALLLQIDPEYQRRLPKLDSAAGIKVVSSYPLPRTDELARRRAAGVRRLGARLSLVLVHIAELTRQIETLARPRFERLTELCGISLLTAGTLAGILGPGRRFANDAQLAAYAGAAPLEASSAGRTRHRLNRGGNRRLNAVLYRIALTQAHHAPDARAYLDRRVSEGKTRREAMRALKRYIARAVWRLWQECGRQHEQDRAAELKTDEQQVAVRPFPLATAV
jgi:transposase